MSSLLENIVESIKDGSQVTIKLTVKGGSHNKFECIYKKDEGTRFSLIFPPGSLPENIDTQANHPVAILRQTNSLFLNASLLEKKDHTTLHMIARETLDPASLREYFRVNTATEIVASYMTGSQDTSSKQWTIKGKTQDLSGSGVLALFDDEPKNSDNIHLEIFLPNTNIKVNTLGHVVHKKRLRTRRWQVSFHFDNISSKHRDAIITYLLSEQRKQLRENVRTADS